MLHFTHQSKELQTGTVLKATRVKTIALLFMLLLLLPTLLLAKGGVNKSSLSYKAASTEPIARAEYNKTTKVLTFLYNIPSATEDENLTVVKFYNPSDNPKWFNGEYSTFYNWTKEIKSATSVIIEESFKNYAVPTCEFMFNEFNNLKSITGLEYLNTTNVKSMGQMFCSCRALTSLDITHLKTNTVTDMYCMFYNCGVSSLDLSNFNTENVTDMTRLFEMCNQLTWIDLSSFNTAKVEKMTGMFQYTAQLEHIYAKELFTTEQVINSNNMFNGCRKLPNFDSKVVDKTHANRFKDGYFEELVAKSGEERIGAVVDNGLTANHLNLNDDKDLYLFNNFVAKKAAYSRTMKEGTKWATLCLPFDVSLDGQNFRAFHLLSTTEDGVELKEMEKVIQAGTPAVIMMKEAETKLQFSIDNSSIISNISPATTEDDNYKFVGIYQQKEFNKDTDGNCFIVKGNMLMNPAKLLENEKTTKVACKPFRAYFVYNSETVGAKTLNISISDKTTAIDHLDAIGDGKAEYYDLQGRRLNEPQKGINIVKRGGKTMKVVIK